ncbi:hypothetical protein [Nonomuraea rhizosphaerae]|uniref:hypothetical protein n=1 Tax=Nonomuraea rhizosphaerae TaxID=2665663 RepID=UPI001C5CFAF2|nr:hypothetical protein [Nonomuraea rhizosphaerae]
MDDVMPYAAVAIGAYGGSVLAKTTELAAGSDVARGTRVLQRIFGRGDAASRQAIERAAGRPGDPAELRAAVAEAFAADPRLAGEIAAMLPARAAELRG